MVTLPAWAAKVSWGAVWGFFKKNLLPILALVAFAFYTYKIYDWGAEGCRQEFAEARAEQAEREVKLREKEAARNTKKGEEVTERVAKSEAKLGTDRERADEYLRENPLSDDCYITDDDARMLNSVGVSDRK